MIDGAEWYESSSDVARLFDWLVEHDLIDKDPASVSYFLHKPWKWEAERVHMLATQNEAATEIQPVDVDALREVLR